MKYTKLEPTGDIPSSRTWHSTSVLKDSKKFCIYGGFDGDKSLNDVYIFDAGILYIFNPLSVKPLSD